MRQLQWMAEGKERAEWERQSYLLCLVYNVNIHDTKKTQPKMPRDFNIFAVVEATKRERASIKDQMDRFFAANPNMPLQRMAQQADGTWREVSGDGR